MAYFNVSVLVKLTWGVLRLDEVTKPVLGAHDTEEVDEHRCGGRVGGVDGHGMCDTSAEQQVRVELQSEGYTRRCETRML